MKKYGFLFLLLLGMQFLRSEGYLLYLNTSGWKTFIVGKPTASDLLISAIVSAIALTCATELMNMVQNSCKRSVENLNNSIKEEDRTIFNHGVPCFLGNVANKSLVISNSVVSVLKLYPVLLAIAAGYTVIDEITR